MSATVCRIAGISKHPNADRLELVLLEWLPIAVGPVVLVTGPHYMAGHMGVYIPPGSVIPGHLAVESWLVGKGSIDKPYTVQSKNMRGITSPGIFMGQWYKKDASDERSIERYQMQVDGGMEPNLMRIPFNEEWIKWRYWRDEWKLGQDVSAELGVV